MGEFLLHVLNKRNKISNTYLSSTRLSCNITQDSRNYSSDNEVPTNPTMTSRQSVYREILFSILLCKFYVFGNSFSGHGLCLSGFSVVCDIFTSQDFSMTSKSVRRLCWRAAVNTAGSRRKSIMKFKKRT